MIRERYGTNHKALRDALLFSSERTAESHDACGCQTYKHKQLNRTSIEMGSCSASNSQIRLDIKQKLRLKEEMPTRASTIARHYFLLTVVSAEEQY